MLKNILSSPVYVCGGIFVMSALALGFAMVSQFVFGLQPCVLCIYQRIPFVITALLGVAGLVAGLRPEGLKLCAGAAFLSGLVFAGGAVIAGYHVGVEQKWWRSFLEGCQVKLPEDPADFAAFIQQSQAVPCDRIPWELFGISMAGYNAALSAGLAVLCVVAAVMLARRANNFL